MAEHSLLIPFLNKSDDYCHGVEFGMMVAAKMVSGVKRIRGYFRTENEEQIRLACYRMKYDVVELEPWEHEGEDTGWVWMVLKRR